MNLKRWILVTLVVTCALFAAGAFGQEVRPVPKDCPPQDGYDWSPLKRPVDRVMWVQVISEQDFKWLCGGGFACTHRFQDIAIVYARNPRWAYSESAQHHEECHAQFDHTAQSFGSVIR